MKRRRWHIYPVHLPKKAQSTLDFMADDRLLDGLRSYYPEADAVAAFDLWAHFHQGAALMPEKEEE